MIAVDTTVLVYAHREDSPWHGTAVTRLADLANSGVPWAIPWPCLHEFLAIVTHPRIYRPPTPQATALETLRRWQISPGLRLLGEGPGYFETLSRLMAKGKVTGARVHDARIAALCLHHRVKTLWSADRDFTAFPELPRENPLIA
jgi:hypothetical protein